MPVIHTQSVSLTTSLLLLRPRPRHGALPTLLRRLLHILLKSPPLGRLPALRIPLARLQHQHTDEDEGQNRVTRGQHPQTVLAADDLLALDEGADRLAGLDVGPVAGGDEAQALDDVGEVDDDADDVEDERGAVKEQVRLAGLEELGEEAEEADRDGDVQDARDDGRRGVQELEVRLQLQEVGGLDGRGRPEQGVVVGEGGEEHAEEEGGCWRGGCVSEALVG